ncbi:MAG: hypothetical protein AAF702_48680 [Chloroflexota bacterium]
MQTLPHIDIVEPERIDAILADPANFAWRAVDSETLDTWTPDLGLTNYPNPSIVRRGAVATSGMASTLRHRFWQTVEGQADHTGIRYIGIVIYDKVGQPSPMDLRLAADEIGRIEPTRQDNRRHLLILEQPVKFVGEMEIFQLTAPGSGEYRIEHFVLLKERPEPSHFTPEIRHLNAVATPISGTHWQAALHFITTEPATCKVEAMAANHAPTHFKTEEPRTLHTIDVPGLAPNCTYNVTVTAVGKDGGSASASCQIMTQSTMLLGREKVTIPVEIFPMARQDLSGYPLTFGIPLPQGLLFDPKHGRIQMQDGKLLPNGQASAQITVHARWPDQSARWALVDTLLPRRLSQEGTEGKPLQAEIILSDGATDGATGTKQTQLRTLVEDERVIITSRYLRFTLRKGAVATAFQLQNRTSNGDWRTLIPSESGQGISFTAVLGNGYSLTTESVSDIHVEQNGATRVLIRCTVDHCDADHVPHLRSTLRFTIYAEQSFIRINHRLTVISPLLAPTAAGGAPNYAAVDPAIHSAVGGHDGETSTLLKVQSFNIHWPWAATGVQALEKKWPIRQQAWRLVHEHDLGYKIESGNQTETSEGRCQGHLTVKGEQSLLTVGIRNFWQTYPKGLTVAPDRVTIELFPQLSGEPLPGDEEAWHRLYFWLQDGVYLLKAGMALSSELLIGFPSVMGLGTKNDFSLEPPEEMGAFAWLENPPLVRPTMSYLTSTQALNPIAAKADSLLPSYETLVDQALESFYQDQSQFRAYGQVNYGDWYGESGWSWGNNEYDPAYCAYIEFLRGGDPRWAEWGAIATRHLVDVDTLNHSARSSEIGGQAMHMPGHLGGYLPPLFRSKMSGTKSIPSHVWVEGPLLHWLLTGDTSVLESILLTKAWLLQDHWFDNYDFSNCREAGWHMIHLCMVASITNDPSCLNGAAIIVERVLEKEEPDGGWVHMLTESHCGCGYPRCRGEAGFMVGVLLSGLKRYHNLTQDERVAKAIIGGAHWLIHHTFDDASGHFRYTSCKNRTVGGGFQQTQWVLEGLAAAYELSGDPEIGHYVQQGLDAIGLFPEGLDHLGLGKALSQQMRYVPTILAALENRPLRA